MEEKLNGTQTQWKINQELPQWKITSMDDGLIGRKA